MSNQTQDESQCLIQQIKTQLVKVIIENSKPNQEFTISDLDKIISKLKKLVEEEMLQPCLDAENELANPSLYKMVGHKLDSGSEHFFLEQNQCIKSNNGCFILVMKTDGNLCFYKDKDNPIGQHTIIWQTDTAGKGGDGEQKCIFRCQDDGNLVVYNCNGQPIWASNTSTDKSHGPFQLRVQDDGNLVLYDKHSKAIWGHKQDQEEPQQQKETQIQNQTQQTKPYQQKETQIQNQAQKNNNSPVPNDLQEEQNKQTEKQQQQKYQCLTLQNTPLLKWDYKLITQLMKLCQINSVARRAEEQRIDSVVLFCDPELMNKVIESIIVLNIEQKRFMDVIMVLRLYICGFSEAFEDIVKILKKK